jgi:hypothetical protein
VLQNQNSISIQNCPRPVRAMMRSWYWYWYSRVTSTIARSTWGDSTFCCGDYYHCWMLIELALLSQAVSDISDRDGDRNIRSEDAHLIKRHERRWAWALGGLTCVGISISPAIWPKENSAFESRLHSREPFKEGGSGEESWDMTYLVCSSW